MTTDAAVRSHPCVIVMGVSGIGKTTVATALARRIGGTLVEADDLHSVQNRAKMAAGISLTDADRAPWLEQVGRRAASACRAGPVVVACSALKRTYRDRLRAFVPEALFVHLHADPAIVAARMQARSHFASPGILPSQLATLEPPQPDERAVSVDSTLEIGRVVDAAWRAMSAT